jgi:hypothetical protein
MIRAINRAVNRSGCERESDVVQGARTGLLSPELHDHVLSCAICTEAQAVARVMLQTASLQGRGMEPPAVDVVWRRAEARKKEIALRRATRPLIFMRALGAVYVALSMAWFLHYLWRSNFTELLSRWNVLVDKATCFTAAIAVLSIVIGAGYLLRDSRRSGEGVPST